MRAHDQVKELAVASVFPRTPQVGQSAVRIGNRVGLPRPLHYNPQNPVWSLAERERVRSGRSHPLTQMVART